MNLLSSGLPTHSSGLGAAGQLSPECLLSVFPASGPSPYPLPLFLVLLSPGTQVASER